MADIESTYTQTLVFDLTGFSLANMVSKMKDILYIYTFYMDERGATDTGFPQDFTQVKFIIQCVQDIYPGSIGLILIHNAPKIFAGR
jgi:hypothetical protein